MLAREDFRRSEKDALVTFVRDTECGECGDRGFAGADIAVQESIHRRLSGEVGEDFFPRLFLGVGQREREGAFKAFRNRGIFRESDGGRCAPE